ncbi:MAG: hypothetical protein JSS35_11970 [Proteobacteria bacterium]|nr:hypothetical protein [Pseudomonadota bacterium]
MDLPLVWSLTAAMLALAVFAGWRGARPPDIRRAPRLIPWRPIMLLAATAAILLGGYGVQLAASR